MDTASVATWSVGTALSAAGLFFAWRIDRRQRASERPVVEIELNELRSLKGWVRIAVVVRNPTPNAWRVETIDVRPKNAGSLILERDAEPRQGKNDGPMQEIMRKNAKAGPVRIGYRVGPGGIKTTMEDVGDTLHFGVFLSLERPLKRISIRVSLRSKDAKARSVTIASTQSASALPIGPTAER